ncbi:hypothetical protein LF1_16430 [Rubripirellula obstinata]|uniref:Abnormal spindle-like microcephaly-associated protein ASH domain-containing protein n=1 Tax=Rubripirellula obstinata TaxID=406547 RepID=A0A5B1CGQ9_9BACT|nr:hypothetical protein [Rubripirellula obstinata]KAA1259115.1 hypothetical protein LF1_16430 [Rubripirellula obstinata]
MIRTVFCILLPLMAFQVFTGQALAQDAARSAEKVESSQPKIFGLSAIKGTRSKVTTVSFENKQSEPSTATVRLAGDEAEYFEIQSPESVSCLAGETIDVQVVFNPPADFVGKVDATLQVTFGDEPPIEHSLRGLSTRGLQGKNEPPLADILETLGYRVDIGWNTLANNVKPKMMGDEISAKLFKSVGTQSVDIIPVARYSPVFSLPFGYYTIDSGKPVLHQVGVLSGMKTFPEHQTLHPALEDGGTSFEPGDDRFGIYTTSPSHDAYSADRWNRKLHKKHATHACRIYAAKDVNGEPLKNQYLFCFEEAFNGDYQDYVFVVRRIEPVVATAPNANEGQSPQQ